MTYLDAMLCVNYVLRQELLFHYQASNALDKCIHASNERIEMAMLVLLMVVVSRWWW